MVTIVGSLNTDLTIEVVRLPLPGETVPGRNFRRTPGGKGANQALAVARMGMAAAMIGAVGQDTFGEEMCANLAGAGVDTVGIMRRPGVASGTAMIVVDGAGQNQIVVTAGANGTLTANDVAQHSALIQRSRAVITQLETPLDAVTATLRLGRQSGALTVLNPAPFRPLSDELLRLCDWIIPNEGEASQLSGLEVRDVDGAAEAARVIKRRSRCPNLLVTLGANGAWLDTPEMTGHVPGCKVETVDTVGAGDTFIGACVTRLVEGAGADVAARFACAAAALAVTRRGAQSGIPSRAEVEAFRIAPA